MTFAKAGVATVTINSGIVLPADGLPMMNHWQSRNVAADGSPNVFNHDVTEWFIYAKMQVNNTERGNLRTFFRVNAEFGESQLIFTPDTGVDAGAGNGSAVGCRLWGDSWSERFIAPGVHECSVILRAYSTGTAVAPSS